MENNTSKVVFWNIWGHRHADDLHTFLKLRQADADIICLTEVTDIDAEQQARLETILHHGDRSDEAPQQVNGFHQLSKQFLSSHNFFYESATRAPWTCTKSGTNFKKVGFGSAMIYKKKKELNVVAYGNEKIHFLDKDIRSRVLQWIVYEKKRVRYLVAHIHGVWIKGNTKGDHTARTEQSLMIRKHLSRLTRLYQVNKVVFGGDLNLDMGTDALRLLEQGTDRMSAKYRNLISERGISSTRTTAYRNFGVAGVSLHADYVLVSKTVDVRSLEVVTDITASDHAPLIVQFS